MYQLKFTVDSALLSELGERLVESVHIALAELIKNAYDADATHVKIALFSAIKGESKIEISDNGTGMSYTDVEKYWMRIATTNKGKNNISPIFGRPKTGAKGIGRFSCRRLGTTLELWTTARAKNALERTHVKFDWLKYKAGTDVTEIECPGDVEKIKDGHTGTKLMISGGNHSEWNQRSWNALKRQMTLLVANRGIRRPGYEEDPGFDISLTAPDFEDNIIVNPREELMNAGWGTLSILVDKEGKLICTLDAKKMWYSLSKFIN